VWKAEGCPDRGREPERKEEEDAAEWVRQKLGMLNCAAVGAIRGGMNYEEDGHG
jgi:hypothetical protein